MENSDMKKKIGERLDDRRNEIGMSVTALEDKSGVSRSAIYRIFDGTTAESRKIKVLAEALDYPISELFDEPPVEPVLDEYTLDDAPVCVEDYHLKLESAEALQLPQIPYTPVTCLIVPWDLEAQENAVRAVYRLKSHNRAMIVEVLEVGDDRVFRSAAVPQSELLQSGEQGQILGAIADLVSAERLFRR